MKKEQVKNRRNKITTQNQSGYAETTTKEHRKENKIKIFFQKKIGKRKK